MKNLNVDIAAAIIAILRIVNALKDVTLKNSAALASWKRDFLSRELMLYDRGFWKQSLNAMLAIKATKIRGRKGVNHPMRA